MKAVFVVLQAPDAEHGEMPDDGGEKDGGKKGGGDFEEPETAHAFAVAQVLEVFPQGLGAPVATGGVAGGGLGEEGQPLPEEGRFDFGLRAGRQGGVFGRAAGADAPEGFAEAEDVAAGGTLPLGRGVAGGADDGGSPDSPSARSMV